MIDQLPHKKYSDFMKLLYEPRILAAPACLLAPSGGLLAAELAGAAAGRFSARQRCTTHPRLLPRGRHHAEIGQQAIQMQAIVSLVSAGNCATIRGQSDASGRRIPGFARPDSTRGNERCMAAR